mgnify:CR=1 FL=1
MLKDKVIYFGGSLPVPCRHQRGVLALEDETITFRAGQEIEVAIPLARLRGVRMEEVKYYSSIGYFLRLEYEDEGGQPQHLLLEVRSFIRRGRALYKARHWVQELSQRIGG